MVLKKIILYLAIFGLMMVGVSVCSAKNSQDEVRSDYAEGLKAFNKGDYKAAIKIWEKCLNYFSNELKNVQNKEKFEEALFLNIGDAYRNLANKERAEESEFYNKALSYYQKIHAFVGVNRDDVNLSLCRLYSDKGRRFREIGMYNRAKSYHEKSLALIMGSLPDAIPIKDELEANERRFLGVIERHLGNYERSKEYSERALELWKSLNPKPL